MTPSPKQKVQRECENRLTSHLCNFQTIDDPPDKLLGNFHEQHGFAASSTSLDDPLKRLLFIGENRFRLVDDLFLFGDLDSELFFLACHELGIILQLRGIKGLTLGISRFLVPHELFK